MSEQDRLMELWNKAYEAQRELANELEKLHLMTREVLDVEISLREVRQQIRAEVHS
jgi:hypothetical protein